MSDTMYDFYLSQFEYMKKIINERGTLLGNFAAFYKKVGPDRIYLLGSGSSFNACSAAKAYMEQNLGVEVNAIAPSDPGRIWGLRPLVIAVSQEGRSTNTVGLVAGLRQRKIPVATLVAIKDSPLAQYTDCELTIGVGEEPVGPKTRGYNGTVISLYLMALEAGRETGSVTEPVYKQQLDKLISTANCGMQNYAACKAFYDVHLDKLKTARQFIFVGKGVAAKVAGEDAIKVLETLCYPAAGYEFEEYIHGPACCTCPETALFLFLAEDEDKPRMKKLVDITARATPNSYLITRDPSVRGENVLNLTVPDCRFMSPFTDVLFGQLISAILTLELGRVCHSAVKDIFSEMDTKVPQ